VVRLGRCGAAVVALLLAAFPYDPREACAQNAAAAEALYNKGMSSLKNEDFEAACPAFEESHRLDPKPGVLFTLAACEQKRGRLATAMTRYEDFLEIVASLPAGEKARQRQREQAAKREKEAIADKVPSLTVVLPPSVGEEYVVKRDGEVMGRPSLGMSLPVDPGEHVVTVHEGDGPAVLTERVTLGLGEKHTLKLPATYPKSKPDTPPPPPGGGEGKEKRFPPALPVAALAVGGTGVVLGSVFGLMALGKKGTVDDECSGTVCRSEEGRSAGETGATFATVSTVGFVVGVLGIGTGVTLLLLQKDVEPAERPATDARRLRVEPEVMVGTGGAFLGARGMF
jgi:hypothetical protein